MQIHRPLTSLACITCLLVTGCATTPTVTPQPSLPPSEPLESAPRPASHTPPLPINGSIRIDQALALTLLQNQVLAAFSLDVGAAEARVQQARLRPNPQLEIELEEFNRDGAGMDSSELVVSLGQLVELGGKRRWRTRVAQAEGKLAGWDYEAMRLDLINATAQRFMAVVIAQRRVELTAAAVVLSEETTRAVGERVKAGKEPALQAAKSEAELQLVRMAALGAAGELDISRRRLASMWGSELPAFSAAIGELDAALDTPLSLSVMRAQLPRNPNLARWDAEIQLRETSLSSARAARIPNMKARIALQRYQEDETDALAFGVGIPLPLFDRNQGNIRAATLELDRIRTERTAMEVALASDLAASYTAWTTAHQRVNALRNNVVPAMEEAFAAAQEGYRQGKFRFLDMLDSQRVLIDTKAGLLDALSAYHIARANVQRITGTTIDTLSTIEMEQE
jgi:cobalt-zinc-cadmium efflux system outer membrane protein